MQTFASGLIRAELLKELWPSRHAGCRRSHLRGTDVDAGVIVRIDEEGADAERLQILTDGLREELLELDVQDVTSVRGGQVPPGSRGVELAAVGALLVSIKGSADLLRSVVNTVRSWLSGRHTAPRTVELTIGDKTLLVTDTSSDQQERLIEQFLRSIARE